MSAASCQKLQLPDHGTYSPPSCITGGLNAGDRCVLHCVSGYQPASGRTIVCDNNLNWSPTPSLSCVAVERKLEENIRTEPVNRSPQLQNRLDNQEERIALENNRVAIEENLVQHEKKRVNGNGKTVSVQELPRRVYTSIQEKVKPFIECPRDTTIILPKGQKTVYIKLEQPKTNVDWTK